MKNLNLLLLFLLGISSSVNAQCISGDCINGSGIWEWESGAVYTGEFEDGNRHGYGHYSFKNGDTYTGEWKNNERHGYGVFHYNGSEKGYKSYAGEWKKNNRSGMGIMTYKNETTIAKFGVWENNKYLYKYKDVGCLKGDCYNGEGVYVWEDGSRYEGNFENGKRSGNGTYYYSGGAKYIGNHANGSRNGQGTYFYPSGNKYTGEWKDEVRVGTGFFYTKEELKELNSFAKD